MAGSARGWTAADLAVVRVPERSGADGAAQAIDALLPTGHVDLVRGKHVKLDTYADLFDADLDGVATALDEARRSAGVAETLPRMHAT
ncbi:MULTISPECIES: hypothetical protein [Microbacterium]|uniref:hypothetical protein n=1 Tax=Microbacterium TaxID=33882 RepID=UPI0027D88AB7|nr:MULTISPECIES: hypothetical protein [Microbacterium]